MKNLLKTIPVVAFSVSQSCSHNKPADGLNKYLIKNQNNYANFREMIKNKNYLSSNDSLTSAWLDSKGNCAMVKRIIDDKLTITFRDYGIDGLTKNDEYVENFETRRMGDLNARVQSRVASSYEWEVEKLIKNNSK